MESRAKSEQIREASDSRVDHLSYAETIVLSEILLTNLHQIQLYRQQISYQYELSHTIHHGNFSYAA